MKRMVAAAILLLGIRASSQNFPADTVTQNVLIGFHYSPSIFPVSWQIPPINAGGEQIAASEVQRSKMVIVKALNKYPADLLNYNLRTIYFLRSMNFYEIGYGGTNSIDAVYLVNNGTENNYSNLYIEQTFHHEFSSILYRNYPQFIDSVEWSKVNQTNYTDPRCGPGAILNNQSSQEFDQALCKKGFLTQYALSCMENDINTIAQNLFSPSNGFWEIVDQYPLIRRKADLLIRFYKMINPAFTEQYFRNMSL